MSNLPLVLLVIAAGASATFQQILNANLRTQIGSPWWAAFVSYFVGMIATLVLALLAPGPRLMWPAQASGTWVAWTGGLFGALFIATVILALPRLGAATVMALIVVGQMVGALSFDHFGLLGTPEHPITMVRLLGAGCLILGVILIRA